MRVPGRGEALDTSYQGGLSWVGSELRNQSQVELHDVDRQFEQLIEG